MYIALYDYQSDGADDIISITKDQQMVLNEDYGDGWCHVTLFPSNVSGIVPRNYIEEMVTTQQPPKPPVRNQPPARSQPVVQQQQQQQQQASSSPLDNTDPDLEKYRRLVKSGLPQGFVLI